jgi:hypothetical protein
MSPPCVQSGMLDISQTPLLLGCSPNT